MNFLSVGKAVISFYRKFLEKWSMVKQVPQKQKNIDLEEYFVYQHDVIEITGMAEWTVTFFKNFSFSFIALSLHYSYVCRRLQNLQTSTLKTA